MPSVVYIIRTPLNTLSPALFSGDDDSPVVLSVEDPILPGKVLRANNELVVGERLSYKQLLAVVLNCEKVLTL